MKAGATSDESPCCGLLLPHQGQDRVAGLGPALPHSHE